MGQQDLVLEDASKAKFAATVCLTRAFFFNRSMCKYARNAV